MKQPKCEDCSKVYSCRQALYAHKKICKGLATKDSIHSSLQYHDLLPNYSDQQIKPFVANQNIQTCSSFPDIMKSARNPKVSTAFIDAIVNNGEPTTPVSSREPFTIPPTLKKVKLVKRSYP